MIANDDPFDLNRFLDAQEAIDIATGSSRREGIRRELLAYCQRDTEAMVVLLDQLLGKREAQASQPQSG